MFSFLFGFVLTSLTSVLVGKHARKLPVNIFFSTASHTGYACPDRLRSYNRLALVVLTSTLFTFRDW